MAGNANSGRRAPAVPEDRREAIKAALKAQDITDGEYIRRAFEQEGVDRVDIEKFLAGSWARVEKIDSISAGFDPTLFESYLETKHGPGRYRLHVFSRSEFVTARTLTPIGDFVKAEAEQARNATAVATTNGNPSSPLAEIQHTLKQRIEMDNVLAVKRKLEAEEKQATTQAELAPIKIMSEMVGTMVTMMQALAAAPKQDSALATLLPILTGMMTSMQTQMIEVMRLATTRPEGGGGLGTTARTLLTLVKDFREAFGGDLGQVLAGGGTDWSKIVEVAAPVAQELIATARAVRGAPPADPAAAGPKAVTAGQGGPDVPQGKTLEQILAEKKDQIDVVVDALRTADFDTVFGVLAIDPVLAEMVLARLNPKMNGVALAIVLKQFDPRFDGLRAELTAFLKWLDDKQAQDRAAAAGAEPGPA